MTLTRYQVCSKYQCNELVYGEVDYSQPAKRYDRVDKDGDLHFVIAFPHKNIERPAWCYFHRKFPNYPGPEPFKVTNND